MKRKIDDKHYYGQKYLLIAFLCFFCLCILMQVKSASFSGAINRFDLSKIQSSSNPHKTARKTNTPLSKKNKSNNLPSSAMRKSREGRTLIELIHADEARKDNFANPDVQVLVGNVHLLHNHLHMFCDSALIHEKTNSVEAYKNIKMEQGDTLFIYGDYLHYDGITQLAQLRGNAKMVNRKTTLLTDSLNYDRLYNLAYYFEGGTLMDVDNVLTSDWGEYSPKTKIAVFNHDVRLVNPRFILTSDTLKYNTRNKNAIILGPSHIVSDKNNIYSKRGVYNTVRDRGWLYDRSVIINGGKKMIGDTLYYDKFKGYGEAFHNVVMRDTINKNILKGNYCYYNDKRGVAYATRKALAIDYSQKDSMFIHADTLYMRTLNQKTDSMYRILRAYHKVRMFRPDMQGVCDSLVYITRDSCLTMYKDPIVWNDQQQLLGEKIKAYFNDTTITWAHIINQALTVEKLDSVHYNQVTGKEIKAYFKNKELNKVDVIGNVLVVYYPLDKDSTMMFMNTSETSLLNLYLKERKLDKMVMSPQSTGILYPMDQLPLDKMRLSNFAWFDYIRPKSKNDLFVWKEKDVSMQLKKEKEDDRLKDGKSLRDLLK